MRNEALAFEQITVGTSGKRLTPGTYTGNNELAVITVEIASIRFRVDAGSPSLSVGVLAKPGDIIHLTSNLQLRQFKAIRAGAIDAIISVNYADTPIEADDNNDLVIDDPQAEDTAAGDGWDPGNGVIAIPIGTFEAHISIEGGNARIVVNNNNSSPSEVGTAYTNGYSHRKRCLGCTYLHWRNGDAGSNVKIGVTFVKKQ